MKLNYKKTIFVGFAFFLICAFWQAYDSIVPMMLVNKFGLSQTVSGVIMSLDNVIAIFLLPLFGSLSDKTKTRFGRRTPYIVIGTIVAALSFFGLTFADNAQLAKLGNFGENSGYETLFDANYEIQNAEYSAITDKEQPKTYVICDYAAKIVKNKLYNELTDEEKTEVRDWYSNINAEYNADHSKPETAYGYDSATKTYYILVSVTEHGKTVYKMPDGSDIGKNVSKSNAYKNLITPGISDYALEKTLAQPLTLVLFAGLLLLTLFAMAIFRSPAVALMPDVTEKPLRSQANAVINLMGTAGGMIVLVLGMVFGTGKTYNQLMSYTPFIGAVCGVMVLGLLMFIWKVREPVWVDEMERNSVKDGLETEEEAKVDQISKKKLTKPEFKSLILILCSVALWYIGYNAVTSKYSLYAMNVLHMDYNTTLLVAQGAAIISYIPVGMLAQRIGRKKSILAGVVMLTAAFFGATFMTENSSIIVLNLLFALAGIGWATINVNSFPMVVEMCSGSDVGRYTGFYYTASMAAQVVTPMFSGFLMDKLGMTVLFPYAAIFVAGAFVTMLFVRHGDSRPIPAKGLEALDVDD